MIWDLVLGRTTTICANFVLSGDHAVGVILADTATEPGGLLGSYRAIALRIIRTSGGANVCAHGIMV